MRMTGLMTSLSSMVKIGWLDWSTYRRLELWFWLWLDTVGLVWWLRLVWVWLVWLRWTFSAVSTSATRCSPAKLCHHHQTCQRFTQLWTYLTWRHSRRTGTVTRPVRTGTGLLSGCVSVIAAMNSFGKPQGLPLIPETVSSPGVPSFDEYDDALGRHHENCISSLSPKQHCTLFDSGVAAHCCHIGLCAR